MFRWKIAAALDHHHPPLFLLLAPMSSVLISPFNDSTSAARTLPALSTAPPLRTHSNARKPISFIRLLHRSLDTPGVGLLLALTTRH
jgi:hypothetical protein